MALSTSEAEQEQQAAQDLALKMKLEVAMAVAMRGFFRDIRRDFAALYTTAGINISAREYNIDLVAILRRHYRRVARNFGRSFRAQIDQVVGNDDARADELIRQLINSRAQKQSNIILRTTQSEFDAALAAGVGAAIVAGTVGDRAKTARAVNKSLIARQTARADTIATTEVNAIAERSKQAELGVLIDGGATVGGIALLGNTVKIWNAVLDEVTRFNHAVADGQVKELGEPFVVGGERLMAPSDGSLGASPGNIINCRCSTQFLLRTGL